MTIAQDTWPLAANGTGTGTGTEAWRQQQLLRVLWQQAAPGALAGWLRESPARAARGWAAYRANAGHTAERALRAAYPTVAELVGDEATAALAHGWWQRCPPQRGDVACWGEDLARHIADQPALAELPWMADVARLDWLVHRCEAAADADGPPAALGLLAGPDAATCRLRLRPGVALVSSAWPVATLWLAHRATGPDRLATARQALVEGRAEHALVWRDGWRARVVALGSGDAGFTQALLDGASLGAALDAAALADAAWTFEPWLLRALQHGWIAAVSR